MMFYVFDLDGTLADIEHRRSLLPDWDAFFEACDKDTPIPGVINVMKALYMSGNRIEIWSGRSDAVEEKTVKWLQSFCPYYDFLRMRPDGDFTPDDEIKEQWLNDCMIKPVMVFDDRDKVVEMWRRNGIQCAQVAPGDF